MARVDPEDDGVGRFVVRYYAYDPDRRERRHQVVAVFDHNEEFLTVINALINGRRAELEGRRASGEEVGSLGSYSGVFHEPGYLGRAALKRLEWHAIQRGVVLSEASLERIDWRPGSGFSWRSQP
jgi:hypothetical protein